MRHRHSVSAEIEQIADQYDPAGERSLAAFIGMLGAFGVLVGVLSWAVAPRRRPVRMSWGDLVRYGLATATISRTIAKDPITSPLRAPFPRFTGETTGPAELKEEVVGQGARKALGELVTCPFCVAPWVGPRWSPVAPCCRT